MVLSFVFRSKVGYDYHISPLSETSYTLSVAVIFVLNSIVLFVQYYLFSNGPLWCCLVAHNQVYKTRLSLTLPRKWSKWSCSPAMTYTTLSHAQRSAPSTAARYVVSEPRLRWRHAERIVVSEGSHCAAISTPASQTPLCARPCIVKHHLGVCSPPHPRHAV